MTQGRKRTKIALKNEAASAKTLRYEAMVINNGNGKREYLDRLRYVNVPTMRQIVSGNEVLANRDHIVRTIYETLQPLPENQSKQTYFLGMIDYFRYIDSLQYQCDVFDNEVMKECIKYFNNLRSRGQQKSKASGIKTSLSFFLRQWDRNADQKNLPQVSASPQSEGQAFHVETELKPLSKVLVRGALAFKKAIEKKEILDVHPFFDEKEFHKFAQKNGWSLRQIGAKKMGFSSCLKATPKTIKNSPLSLERLNKQTFYNHASRNWFFVFSMMVGMNKSVLANIRYRDVTFRDIGGGRDRKSVV